MKKSLLSLFMAVMLPCVLFAQSIPYVESSELQSKTFPFHVSDKLNSPELLKKLHDQYQNSISLKKQKSVVDEVGDERNFFVYNFTNERFESKSFRLLKKGTLTQIWFEIDEIDNGHLTPDVADSMFKYLEEVSNQYSFKPEKGIIELSNEYLGDPPNYDGDGLVDFLITDIQDGYDPNEGGGYTAGFFYSVDQFPDNPLSYRSNERDVLYIDSYPGIYSGGERNAERPLPTLSHEYQHLIHYNYNGRLGQNELSFINEAQSNFASLLSGYFPHNSYGQYLENPNVPIFRWQSGNGVLDDYGRAASFSGYLWDHLGFENSGYLTQSPLSGVSGINDAIAKSGSSLQFEDILVNWGVANLLNRKQTDDAHGYEHPFLTNLRAPVSAESPKINRTDSVESGGIQYLRFQQVTNLNITVSHSGSGEMRLITKNGDATDVITLGNAQNFTTSEDVLFDEIYLMLVHTDANASKLGFSIQSTGEQAYDLATYSTHSQTPKFYWNIPYENVSGEGRLGFSNKYVAESDGLLHTLELFIVSGTDGSTGEPIEVKGSGQLRIAAYSDDNGSPDTEIAADSIDFNELSSDWQSFDVTDWDINLQQGDVIHIVYEAVVENINPDINAIPLRLDDGTGTQNVSNIVTGPDQFVPFFKDSDTNGEHGVWNRYILAQPVSNEDEPFATAPATFELSQNYPNPFNPATTINYTLPNASDVQLTVYNMLGQQVASLVNERMPAGSHSVRWDAQQASSGVYLYKLTAGNFIQTRKMILLK